MSREKCSTGEEKRAIGTWFSRLSLGLDFLLLLVFGGYIAGVALHDPDSCWLLGMGRWIVEHGRLPYTDPFSYTYALVSDKPPFVLYQWLTEVFFYASCRLAGLPGLLFLTALILASAYLILPFRLLSRLGVPLVRAQAVVLLATLAAAFHFLARPEIFSYLLVALWLNVLYCPGGPRRQALLVVLPLTMGLWANLHSGFIVGILILGTYVFCCAAESRLDLSNSIAGVRLKVACASFALCLAATLINPWQFGLWKYLPHLFFSPVNRFIQELGPLGLAELTDGEFVPFLILVLSGAFIMLKLVARKQTGGVPLFAALLFFAATAMGFACRRLIPFSALLMVPAIGTALSLAHAQHATTVGASFIEKWDRGLQELGLTVGRWAVAVYFMSALGCLLIVRAIPPALPQPSVVVHPPRGAWQFLERERPDGRLFNDPEFGDALIWNLKSPPALFIDSRFDMYGPRLVGNYRTLSECGTGWRDLLAKYSIAWIFLPPNKPLVRTLKEDPHWATLYCDVDSVIMVHKK